MELKFLIISDTHEYIANAVSLIDEIRPDTVIHLGDMANDCDELSYIYPMQRMICVLGNNDYFVKKYPTEIVTELGGKKFLICHGHKYNVKYGLSALTKRAKDTGADCVLFGHTHNAFLDFSDDFLIMNPGSRRSYGIIEIENGIIVNAEIKDA